MDVQLREYLCSLARQEGFSVESCDEFVLSFNFEGDYVQIKWINTETFPFEIPEFQLVGNFPDKLIGIPHVSPDGRVCVL